MSDDSSNTSLSLYKKEPKFFLLKKNIFQLIKKTNLLPQMRALLWILFWIINEPEQETTAIFMKEIVILVNNDKIKLEVMQEVCSQ